MEQTQKAPSPELIFKTISAYQDSGVLKGAIELEVFSAIAEGATSVPALAARCKASERGMRIMADYLTVLGLLTKQGNAYGLTPDSALFLDKKSRAYMGSVSGFLMAPDLMQGFNDIAGAVRKGGTIIPNDGTVAVENPVWVEFARSMAPMMMPAAQAIPEVSGTAGTTKLKVLDIAAGHGLFGIMMAAKNPNAEIVALDWPMVLEVAEENAQKFGVGGRWKKLAGDARTIDYGSDFDVVLLTNFLHHFDAAGCESILRKTRAALKPGGRTMALEFVPNEDRVTPPMPATFSMVMLASTPSGDAYTYAELDRMFLNAGFRKTEIHQLQGLPQTLVVGQA